MKVDVNSPKRRRIFLSLAPVAIVLSVVVLVFKGLNLGIDFKGGTQITFKTPTYTSLAKVRDQAAAIGKADAVIQRRGTSQGESYKSFQVRTKSLKPGEQERLSNDLEAKL